MKPSKTPSYGDTVYFINDNGNAVKAQVTDVTPHKEGIKMTVVPSANSPFPVRAKYGNGKTPGTWTWDEPKDDNNGAEEDDKEEK